MKISHIAILCASSVVVEAQPHNHHHHHHQARNVVPNGVRVVTSSVTVKAPVVTVYELNGKKISNNEVDSCLKESKCVIVGTKITSTPSPNAAGRPIAPSQSPKLSSTPTQSSLKFPDTPAPSATAKTSASSNNDIVDQHQNNALAAVNAEFPSGRIDCSEFPSAYGAVAADWVGLGGWTGVQKTPGYSTSSKAIGYIETAVAGDGCTPGSFCSYSCPAGYQKSQWPAAQGVSGQSIGGLYCNSNGKLELSRSSSNQICTPGVGNIQIKNLHTKNVAICRTDYPGTESQTVALNSLPGSTVRVTCPDSKDYYRTWEGSPTSAQYYINPSGNDVEEACTWGSAGSNLGNWAPVNMGVGKAESGTTFVSLFPNVPTNPNGVLDFNIEITGDVTGRCAYRNGRYYKDGVISPTGCTVS
ncbi:Secreted beta-glucosidase sun1 [Erysiphe neolycopersici]|uniref:Secreted beta-glucosidase sun1 n=1 Tax=Erysiphe neolycopersici TaxID=212602 RepID=A0A420I4V2_9PEZI|nr:Secreted beta-glucosidase sun1 [Erysiphe neolycopersici]